MIRWLSRIFFGILGILLLLFIFLVTPVGFHVSLNLIEKALPGKLSYQHIGGNIFSPINVSNLVYDSKTIHLSVQQAHLEWRLPMLLFKTVDIVSLRASDVNLQFKKGTGSSFKFTSSHNPEALTLPFAVRIKDAEIKNVNMINRQGKTDSVIRTIQVANLTLSNRKIHGTLTAAFYQPYNLNTRMTLSGKLSGYQIRWVIEKGRDKLVLIGNGDRHAVTLSLNESKVYDSVTQGTVNIRWFPYWSWTADVNIKQLNLRQFYPTLPKINYVYLQSTGYWKNKLPVFDMNVDINAKETSIVIKGKHKTEWQVNYAVKLNQLNELFPDYAGSLQGSGTILGATNAPRISGKIAARDLRLEALSASILNGTFDLDFSLLHPSHVTLDGEQVHTPYLHANKFALNASTTQALQTMQANVIVHTKQNHTLQLDVGLQGQKTNNTWQGTLNRFTVRTQLEDEWQLKAPARLLFSPQKIKLHTACWVEASRHLCLNMHWEDDKPWSFKLEGDVSNLNALTNLFYPSLSINAPTLFAAEISGVGTKLTSIKSHMLIKSGMLSYTDDLQTLSYPLTQVAITANNEKNDVVTDIKAKFAKNDSLTSQLTLTNFISQLQAGTAADAPIKGNIQFKLSSLKPLQMLTSLITDPKGQLQGNLAVSGSLPLPDMTGKIMLTQGMVEVPQLKIKLHDIAATLHARNKILTYAIEAKTDGSSITAKGSTQYKNNKFISTIAITGDNILVANTPQYYVVISPDLEVKAVGKGIVVTGHIKVPKALLKPLTFTSTVTLPDDVVIIDQRDHIKQRPFNWIMNVTLSLGKEVKVDTRGLTAQLQGKLQITRAPEQPNPVATGQISLAEATFTTQGKVLAISKGSSINYIHDTLTNPHLSIIASRSVSVISNEQTLQLGPTKTNVGIDVKGTVQHPIVVLFSSPLKLSQADIMSYLLFDSPASANSLGNLSTVLSTITNLNLNSTNKDSSISQIKQKLGITELGVQQQTYVDLFGTPLGVNQSAFVIGSYITPKIYVRYNRGLLTRVNIYEVRYLINKNWSVQTETGTGIQGIGTGVDILYTISRKKFPW